jgi:histidine triad (HIT) family protein
MPSTSSAGSSVASFRVFENDRTLAFMDINPVNPRHALVVPKVHAESILTLDEPWLTTVLVAQQVARAVQKVFKPYGLNIVQANGQGPHSRSRISTGTSCRVPKTTVC